MKGNEIAPQIFYRLPTLTLFGYIHIYYMYPYVANVPPGRKERIDFGFLRIACSLCVLRFFCTPEKKTDSIAAASPPPPPPSYRTASSLIGPNHHCHHRHRTHIRQALLHRYEIYIVVFICTI